MSDRWIGRYVVLGFNSMEKRDTRRLTERFQIGDSAEIVFASDPTQHWIPCVVTAHAAPGIWVMIPGGNRYFVTNASRIRHREIT
jgi:hypothetical protein